MPWDDWPEFMPDPILKFVVSGGQLTVDAVSELVNVSEYANNLQGLKATLLKNGAWAANLAVDGSTGDITLGQALAVSTGDVIEARLIWLGRVSCPWNTRVRLQRSYLFSVPSGGGTFEMDRANAPVPRIDLTFGWNANNKLKVGFEVEGDGGASQDLSVKTRLLETDTPQEGSTTIDLDTQDTQVHESTFVKADLWPSCELEMALKSATGLPRIEDVHRIQFLDVTAIPAYPADFPSSGVRLQQVKVTGTCAAKFQKP